MDNKYVPEVIKTISTKFDKIVEINHAKGERMDDKEKIYVVAKVVANNPVLDMYNKITLIENIENVYITNMNFER